MSATATRTEVFATRFDHCLTQLRGLARTNSKLQAVYDELVRLRRDMAGLEVELPAPAEASGQGRSEGSLRVLRVGNSVRFATKNRDGKRHCPKHDGGKGAWLLMADFDVKNQETGALRSWCRGCTKAYQRERYVRVGAKVMTVELIEGDFLLGHQCPCCNKPFKVGERVQGDNLRHERC